jgi:hypothetical protein
VGKVASVTVAPGLSPPHAPLPDDPPAPDEPLLPLVDPTVTPVAELPPPVELLPVLVEPAVAAVAGLPPLPDDPVPLPGGVTVDPPPPAVAANAVSMTTLPPQAVRRGGRSAKKSDVRPMIRPW